MAAKPEPDKNQPSQGLSFNETLALGAAAAVVTIGASFYFNKINNLVTGAIFHYSKNPGKLYGKQFFLPSAVSVSR